MKKSILSLTLVLLTFAVTTARAEQPRPRVGEVLNLRAVPVNGMSVAVTPDYRFFVVICHTSLLFKSSADLILPNSSGDFVTDDYRREITRMNGLADRQSPYIQLSDAAAKSLCDSKPKGTFTIRIEERDRTQLAELI